MDTPATAGDLQRSLALLGLGEAERGRLAGVLGRLRRSDPDAHAALAALLGQAGENSRLKSLFLRLSMRELEGPFRGVQEKVRALAKEADPWRVREEMSALVETAYRLNRLMRDLIDTADIESGALRLSEERVDLSSLLSDRIGKRLGRLRGFRLLPELPARPLVTRGDRHRLTLLLDDLLDAAIHLTPGGGTVLVRLGREGEEIVVSTRNRTARLPAGRLAAFLEFVQEGRPGAEALEGVGVALYRAYRMVQMLGGRLALSDSPGEGASFTVRIPAGGEKDAGGDG